MEGNVWTIGGIANIYLKSGYIMELLHNFNLLQLGDSIWGLGVKVDAYSSMRLEVPCFDFQG